jgi:hypothetical protein
MELAPSGNEIPGPGPAQMPPDYIIPDQGPNSGDTLLANLNRIDEGQLIPPDQKRILISLMLMVNKADPTYRFDFLVCEQFLAGTIAPIIASFNTGADPGSEVARINEEIYQDMIDMAIASNAPIGSPTILKVQWGRRAFLYLLGIGIPFATLVTMFPIATATAANVSLEYANYLFQVMTTGGMRIMPADIAAGAVSNPPFSVGVFASNVGRAAASAASSVGASAADLTLASFVALARGAGSCLRFAVGSANYALCKASEYLTLNLLTSGVKAVVGLGVVRAADSASAAVGSAVGAAGESAYAAAMGASDEVIANFIDQLTAQLEAQIRAGATRENLIAAVTGAVEIFQAVFQNLTAGIDASKEIMKTQILQSIRDMAVINQNLNTEFEDDDDFNKDEDWVPNRFVGPSINEIIRVTFGEKVLLNSELFRTYLGKLISLLSEIRVGTEHEEEDIQEVADILRIPPAPNHPLRKQFRALIALWKLSVQQNRVEMTESAPIESEAFPPSYTQVLQKNVRNKGKIGKKNIGAKVTDKSVLLRTASMDPRIKTQATKKKYGPERPFESNVFASSPVVNPIPEFLAYYNDGANNLVKEVIEDRGLFPTIASQRREKQLELIDALTHRTESKIINNQFPKGREKAINFNKEKILETIFRILGGVNPGSMNIDDDEDDVYPQSAASAASAASAPNNYYNLGGRKRKSMRHKKRRSTLKRRGLKRRKTRKGKKRRYTKKRR